MDPNRTISNHFWTGARKESTTYNLQPTTYNLQPTTYNLQPTTYNLQPTPTTYNLQPTTYNLQPTTYSLQPTTYNLEAEHLVKLQGFGPGSSILITFGSFSNVFFSFGPKKL
jgi:hypothetical protein